MFGDVTETGNSSNSHPSLPIPPMKSRLTLLLSLSVAGSLCHCHTFWTKALLPGARSFELVWSCCSLWDDNEWIDRSEFVAHRFYNMSFQTSWLGTIFLSHLWDLGLWNDFEFETANGGPMRKTHGSVVKQIPALRSRVLCSAAKM